MAQDTETDSNYISRHALNLYSFDRDPKASGWAQLSLPSKAAAAPSSIRVISWNVDFMAEHADHRLMCALDHLQSTVVKGSEIPTSPPCILLQEVEDEAIHVILDHSWVQENFNVSPISSSDWHQHSHYGSVTLVHKTIPVSNVFKIAFEKSVMGRFVLLVDLNLGIPTAATVTGAGHRDNAADERSGGRQDAVTFRLASVHLESLPEGAGARPRQLRAVASALKEEQCFGGMVCGDMNAIQESDRNTPAEVGLLDAFQGEDSEGLTWGFQPKCRFPPGRLDKILYTPALDTSFSVDAPALVGVGLCASVPREGGNNNESVWASDHYGLATTLSIKQIDS